MRGFPCAIQGCKSDATNEIGIRCRVKSDVGLKRKTNALWAPDTGAFLCDEHAVHGALIEISIQPRDDFPAITTRVNGKHLRTTIIKRR